MKNIQIFPEKFGVFPYIFLVYLVMPLYYVMNESGLKVLIGYLLLFLFLLSYRQLYSVSSQGSFSIWLALQIGIMMILSIAYNPYNLFLGFFSANFIGWYENKKHFKYALFFFASAIVFTLSILTLQGAAIDMLTFLPFAVVMIGAPFGIRSMNKRMKLEQQLEQANEQIKELVKREERLRIARDLHDTLGHTLSLITLQSQLVQRIAEKQPKRAKAEATEIEMSARSALRQVRELVSDMRTITISEELTEMEQIMKVAGIHFQSEGLTRLAELPPLQQNILGMCLREAATNIVKHSKAKRCKVTFRNERGNFTIFVEDDGIGFIEEDCKGNGLIGMRERLALIEGRLKIESGKGTKIAMTVPVVVKQEEVVAL